MFEQMKGLSPAKKVEYYIQYYGLVTAIVVVIAVVVIGLMVHFATYRKIAFGILAVNVDSDMTGSVTPDDFSDFLTEHGVDPKRNQILVNSNIFIREDVDSAVRSTNEGRVMTLLMSQSADVVFADQAYFADLAATGYLADLREYLSKELLERHRDELVYAVDPETGKEIVAGIRVSADTPWMQKVNWYRSSAVAGLSYDMRNEELAVDILLEALGEEQDEEISNN